MEKINIAKILKDCPSGMELNCFMYEDVYFDYVDEFNIIHCYIQCETYSTSLKFYQYGTPNSNTKAKCVIFPKGKTTWEGFVPPCKFKDGDILFVKSVYSWVLVYKESKNNEDLYKYVAIQDNHNHTYIVYDNNPICCKEDVSEIRLATEEEKSKLFDAIKANGYKWNPETKTLEKLIEPKFKVGDIIQDIDTYKVKITEVNIEDGCYEYESIIAKGIGSIPFSEQDNWELIPNKFDITTLKPFDKVLMRSSDPMKWTVTYYSHKENRFFVCCGLYCKQCIPYEENKHLLGTTDDCDDFYKTWE